MNKNRIVFFVNREGDGDALRAASTLGAIVYGNEVMMTRINTLLDITGTYLVDAKKGFRIASTDLIATAEGISKFYVGPNVSDDTVITLCGKGDKDSLRDFIEYEKFADFIAEIKVRLNIPVEDKDGHK